MPPAFLVGGGGGGGGGGEEVAVHFRPIQSVRCPRLVLADSISGGRVLSAFSQFNQCRVRMYVNFYYKGGGGGGGGGGAWGADCPICLSVLRQPVQLPCDRLV